MAHFPKDKDDKEAEAKRAEAAKKAAARKFKPNERKDALDKLDGIKKRK